MSDDYIFRLLDLFTAAKKKRACHWYRGQEATRICGISVNIGKWLAMKKIHAGNEIIDHYTQSFSCKLIKTKGKNSMADHRII